MQYAMEAKAVNVALQVMETRINCKKCTFCNIKLLEHQKNLKKAPSSIFA
jgi:hypothetical protein